MKKNVAIIIILQLFILQLVGCASVQKDMADFWHSVKASLSEKQSAPREEAIQKYGYKGQRDEIYTELPILTPSVVKLGQNVNHELQYAILSPQKNKRFIINEVVILSGSGETMELAKRETEKPQGMHVSAVQFTIPKDLDPGIYKIITSLSAGNVRKTVQGEFTVSQ